MDGLWIGGLIAGAALLGWLRLISAPAGRMTAATLAPSLDDDAPARTIAATPDANLTRDLLAPLNLLSGLLELMRADAEALPPRHRQTFDHILEAETRLRRRLEALDPASRPAPRRERIDPQVVLHRVCEAVSEEARRAGVSLHRPPLAPGLSAWADAVRLERALTVLVRGAIARNRPGGAVLIHLRRDADGLAIVVRDTAPGRGPAVAADLVEARTLIEEMDGRLTLDRQEGEGLRVVVRLAAPDEREGRAREAPLLPPLTLIHITADPTSRLLLKGLLGPGARLHAAETVREGAGLARALRPEAVLIDDATDAVRAADLAASLAADPLTREIAVVLLADGLRPIDARRARRLGVAASVAAPLTQTAVVQAIRSCLEDARADAA